MDGGWECLRLEIVDGIKKIVGLSLFVDIQNGLSRLDFINGGQSPLNRRTHYGSERCNPVLHNVADAIANGVDPADFVAAMHRNPQGDVA